MKTIEEVIKENPEQMFFTDSIHYTMNIDILGDELLECDSKPKVYLAKEYKFCLPTEIVLEPIYSTLADCDDEDADCPEDLRADLQNVLNKIEKHYNDNYLLFFNSKEEVNIDKLWEEITNEK